MLRYRTLRVAALAGASLVFGGDLLVDTLADAQVVSRSAAAQGRGGRGGGMRGMGGMREIQELLQPQYSRRDMPLFVEQLQLDDGQRAIVEALIQDYEDEFSDGSEAVQADLMDLGRSMMRSFMGGGAMSGMRDRARERVEEIRAELAEAEAAGEALSEEERRAFFRERMEGMQQEMMEEAMDTGVFDEARGVMTEMLDILESWVATSESLGDRFVQDTQIQLTDDQLVLWPAFERFLTREKSLPRGRLSGEEVNLFSVVDGSGISDAAYDALEGLFDQYELELHQALVTRDDYLLSSAPKLFKAMRDGDVEDAERVLKQQLRLREAVRNVNDRFREQFLAAIVDEAERSALDMAILQQAYDRVYRPTWGQRSFDAALELEDLAPETMEAVATLQASFLMEIGGINRNLVQELRKSEADRQIADGTRMVAMMGGDFSRGMPWGGGRGGRDGGDDGFREGMDKRGEVDRRYVEQLRALLSPEQQEALPAERGRGGRGGRGGGEGGGDSERRAEMMRRFDKNGDGELDDEERRAMFESFRNGGGGGGGRGGEGGRGGRGGQGGRGG